MSDYCRHGNYLKSKCKTCAIEDETPVGHWYVYVYNTSDRYEVSDQATLYERTHDVNDPIKISEFSCGDAKSAELIAKRFNKVKALADQYVRSE